MPHVNVEPQQAETDADIAAALRTLKLAGRDTEAAASVREAIAPLLNGVVRQQRRQQRLKNKPAAEVASESLSASVAAKPAEAAAAAQADSGVVRILPPNLSRPLYANPVCFLSTWQGTRANLMTISWLAPIDNDGHFSCSMNQRRFSARNLAANPFFVLNVAVAGLEPLLCKVGSCSGRGIRDKPRALGVPLCRPGWQPLQGAASGNHQPLVDVSEGIDDEGGRGGEGGGEAGEAGEAGDELCWPSESTTEIPAASAAELECAHQDAVAVAPCIAHVLARVQSVRGVHGHYLIVAETVAAYARAEYWSGKTLAPQREELPPLLSFLGSQRFSTQHEVNPNLPKAKQGAPEDKRRSEPGGAR